MPRGKGPPIDLTGRRFGRLTVIGLSGIKDRVHAGWECRCDCGNAVFTDSHKLTTGHKISCGCLVAEARSKRLASDEAQQQRFAFEAAYVGEDRPLGVCCIVGCGKSERSVGFCNNHYALWNRYGHPLAGTLQQRRSRVRIGRSKERAAYGAMKSRCFNPNVAAYPNYGGRGITVCERWVAGFDNFFADMGAAPPGHSLERIDVNGNYEPSNCRWASQLEQMRNMRTTRLTAALVGEAKARSAAGETIAAIARSFDVPYFAVYQAVKGVSWKDIEATVVPLTVKAN